MSESSIWTPSPKQALVLSCPYDEILYGGAAGGGKTDLLLGDYMNHSIHAELDGKASSGVIFRRTYKELEQIAQRSHEIFKPLGWTFSKDKYSWTTPGGSRLYLSYLDSYEDALGHRGFEYDYEGFDELTLWPSNAEYEYLGTRLRSSKGVRLRRVSTSNPGGAGHLWVKRHWHIDEYPLGMTPFDDSVVLGDGRTIKTIRIFIPSKLKDNPYLFSDGRYEAELRKKPKAIQEMLLEGRWDIVEGAFFDEWDPSVHVCRPFNIPKDWRRIMSGDWGTGRPYAFIWKAISPHGDEYIYRELYGQKEGAPLNTGTRESAATVAERINVIERLSEEWVTERYIDSSCFDNLGHETTIADQFRQKGIVFQRAHKKNKKASVSLARDALKIINGKSRTHVFEQCRHFIRTIPALQVDAANPDLYDTDSEDHMADAWLYGLRRNMADPSELLRDELLDRINDERSRCYGSFGCQ